MGSTRDPAVHFDPNGVITGSVSRAYRRPTPLDWQRWAPRICAYYKSVPARVLIAEMTAEGLLVTEKMFRDRLRQWGNNDKNRRALTPRKRPAMQSTNDRDKTLTDRGSHDQAVSRDSSKSGRHVPNISDPLRIPTEFRSVQQALKSMQDWQAHFHDSRSDQLEILKHTDSFYFLLRDISLALTFDRSDFSMCGKATRTLRTASAAFRNCLGPMCTPIAVLSSIQLILRIVSRRDTDKWYESTSKFLLQIVTETLPGLHPTPLLLHALLLQKRTAEGLALIYEAGSTLMQLCHSKSTAINFRLDFLSAALDLFPEASFATETDLICQTTMTRNSLTRKSPCVKPDVSKRRSDEVVAYSMRCSCTIDRGRPTRSVLSPQLTKMRERKADYYAWRILCNSQRMQCGFSGEDIAVFNAHALMATMSDPRGGPELRTTSAHVLRKLHLFYKEHDLVEHCQALRLEYPWEFEL